MSASNEFVVVGESPIHRGHTITVSRTWVEDPEAVVHERDVVRHPGAVSVVAVDGDHVLMVRQYRVAPDRYLLEIPAGKLDVIGEDPSECARRELAEEVGMAAGQLTKLASVYLSPGYSDEYHHIYKATDVSPLVASAPDGAEERFMTVERVPISALRGLITSGQLCDAKSIIGCTLAFAADW